MRWLEFVAYKYTFVDYPSLSRLSPSGIYDQKGYWATFSRKAQLQIFAIFKFLAVGIMTDRL